MALSAFDIQKGSADTTDAGIDLFVDTITSPSAGSAGVTKLAVGAAGTLTLVSSAAPVPVELFDVSGTAAADITAIKTAVEIIDNAISGNEMQVDIVSSALPSGAATAAKQPALGTAGTASSDVITVQGIASMTALVVDGSAVTQPVSGTITANLSATDNAVLDSIDAAVNGTLTVGSHAVTNAGTFAVQAACTNAGTFAVQVDGNALTALQLIDDAVFADDAAFTLASSKVMVSGAIRDDSLSTLTAIEGDAVPLRVSSTGALHVTGAGGGTQYNVDDAAGGTDTGTLALAIRDDSLTTLTPADGDYVGLRVSSTGALHVTGGGGGTEYTEDVATANPIVGTATMMERDDALATLTPIEGDWAAMRCSSTGALWVAVDGTVTVGSHAVTNAGTFAVQVDGDALTALQLIDDAVYTDGSGTPSKGIAVMGTDGTNPQLLSVNTTGHVNIADGGNAITVDWAGTAPPIGAGAESTALRVTLATDSTGVVSIDDNGGSLTVDVPAVASGGATPGKLISAATTNATSVKGSAATLYSLCAFNLNASPRYLKIYDKATSPTIGTDTPVLVFMLPGNTAGAGFVFPIPASGIAFTNGLAFGTTTGIADSDTGAVAANEIAISYAYK